MSAEAAAPAIKRARHHETSIAEHIGAVVVESTYSAAAAGGGKVIGTHSGSFHCDEALACGLLLQLPQYRSAAIVRSRDKAELERCDVVVDVGGEYNAETNRFDHHQRSFTGTMTELDSDIKLSSAGLVYRHFGKAVLRELAGTAATDATVDLMFNKMYKNFIREVDAIDNGVKMSDGEPSFTISTNLSARVGHLNPAWNEDSSDADVNARFRSAVLLTISEFAGAVARLVNSWLPARAVVEAAYNKRREFHASGHIMVFDGHCPWKGHLADIEAERAAAGTDSKAEEEPQVLYVLYSDAKGNTRVQCVPVSPSSFENRKSLPEPWCGLRDEELSTAAGIEGCIFIHTNGFIGGAKSFDSAMKIAVAAVEWPTKSA